jgi:acetyl esterase/lipase
VMARRVNRLRGQGTTVEFHRYPNVGHGFGLGTGTSADGWVREAIRFWERSGRRGGHPHPEGQRGLAEAPQGRRQIPLRDRHGVTQG